MGHPFRCITNNPMLIDRGFTDLGITRQMCWNCSEWFSEGELRIPSSYASADRKHPAGYHTL